MTTYKERCPCGAKLIFETVGDPEQALMTAWRTEHLPHSAAESVDALSYRQRLMSQESRTDLRNAVQTVRQADYTNMTRPQARAVVEAANLLADVIVTLATQR